MSKHAGLRGIFELIHLMVERPAWNEKAFERACTSVVSASRAVQKSMERANYDRASEAVYGADRRFREPSAEEVGALSIGDVKGMVEKWLRPDNLEVPPAPPLATLRLGCARLLRRGSAESLDARVCE